MIQGGDSASLLLKPGAPTPLDPFHRHDAVKPCVPRLPHLPHAARANRGKQQVGADVRPGSPGCHNFLSLTGKSAVGPIVEIAPMEPAGALGIHLACSCLW